MTSIDSAVGFCEACQLQLLRLFCKFGDDPCSECPPKEPFELPGSTQTRPRN